MSLMLYLCILVLLIAFICYKYGYDYGYWKRKGVYFIKPLPFVGNLYDVFNFRYSFGHLLEKFYTEVDLPYFGIYLLNKPCLVVNTPELIQWILIRDFNHFCDRVVLCDEKCDLALSKSLSAVKNPYWKLLRGKLAPIFSSAKIKNMFFLINEIAEDQNIYIGNDGDRIIQTKELCTKYMTDFISSCLFGINAHSFEEENTQFRNLGRQVYEFTYKKAFSRSCYIMAHSIVKLFKLKFVEPSVNEELTNAVLRAIREREKTTHVRHDLIDIIIEMKSREILDEECAVAQIVLFYLAAYDTTSTAISFTLYELALHPEIQDKLRSEIQSAIAQHNGAFTYENTQSMNYLDMVFCETLRKYPPIGFIDRVCVKDYAIPGTDVVIDEGVTVAVSISGLHHDEKYFAEPEKYDPERFSNGSSLYKFSYMPFGDGPRNCIGKRLGVLAAKLSIARIISEYELEPCDSTPIPVKYDSKSFFLGAVGGLPLRFKKIPFDAHRS